MTEFLEALSRHGFLQSALAAGMLASLACGVVGSYVVARRISYLAGSIAHCALGGIGVARYLQEVAGWRWFDPLLGATIASLVAAVIIGLVSLWARQREDTVIGALWAIGMAIGIVFIARTPGYNSDLLSYLFGNILLVGGQDLRLIAVLDVLIVAVAWGLYHPLVAVCFDEEFARLRGVRVEVYYLLLLVLTALTVVLLVSVVGVVLVIALITLPAAVAGHFAKTMWQMMVLASLISVVAVSLGLALSYGPGIPAGATIILLAAAVYLVVAAGSRLRSLLLR